MCPQTVWTFIFIWFEEKIEGTANQRRKLDQQPNNANKVIRKLTKHGAWLLFSLLTAMTFAGYFSPMQDLVVNVLTLETSVTMAAILAFFYASNLRQCRLDARNNVPAYVSLCAFSISDVR
jgi:polyferredoxin